MPIDIVAMQVSVPERACTVNEESRRNGVTVRDGDYVHEEDSSVKGAAMLARLYLKNG
jgi:hypothetical protein